MEESKKDEKLEACLARIRELVAKTVEESKVREDEELAAGKILIDNPIARQMAATTTSHWGAIPAGSEYYEHFECLNSSRKSARVLLFTGTTRYLMSRRQWRAYKPAVEILRSEGVSGEGPLYGIFHYVPGVMVFITNGERILAGVRSRNLAGTHVGMVSFPAGLMKPGETLDQAAVRQLKEESGIHFPERLIWTAEARNPDAPQSTFCIYMHTRQSSLCRTFEAEGETFVWVSLRESVLPALNGDVESLLWEFRRQGIELAADVQIAPDASEGLRGIF